MSKSLKKTGGYYITLSANKPGVRKKEKRVYNRIWRRTTNCLLNLIQREEKDENCLKIKHDEIIDKWSMAQDGDYIVQHDKNEIKYFRK